MSNSFADSTPIAAILCCRRSAIEGMKRCRSPSPPKAHTAVTVTTDRPVDGRRKLSLIDRDFAVLIDGQRLKIPTTPSGQSCCCSPRRNTSSR